MRGVCPTADDRCDGSCIDEVVFLYDEVRALEECGYGTSEQQRTDDAIQGEEELECLRTKEIAYLVLELITYCLKHEGEEDNHPQPVGSSETR